MSNQKVISKIKINKKETETTVKINNDNKPMKLKDVKKIIRKLVEKGNEEYDYFDVAHIRILNGDRWATFKTEEDYLLYYEGKVRDVEKFTDNIMQLHVTVYSR